MKAFQTERLLARAFFGRFFENDVMAAVPQAQLVVWCLAAMAAPGFMTALRLGGGYTRALIAPEASPVDPILRDQLLYVTYSMLALGFVAMLTWDGVFPDRRDARMLGVLPISTRTHVAGRLASLGVFATLFSVGINLPSAVAYGLVLFVHEVAAGPVRPIAAHLIATAVAGGFAFFLLILAQGILLNVFGRTMARRLGLLLQSVFVVVLLQALIFVPFISARIGAAFRDNQPSMTAWLPQAWFLALFDVLAGTRRSADVPLALVAVVTAVAVVLLATGLIASSYRRLVRLALETPDGGDGRSTPFGGASRLLAAVLRLGPVQRAVAGFTLRSLGRSRTHLTLLATSVGLAAALVVTTLLPVLARGRTSALGTPTIELLSLPLVCYFFMLLGLRALVGIPTEIKANWVFRLHAPDDRIPAVIAGIRTALVLAVVAPIAIVAGCLGTVLWGLGPGAIHLGVTAALGMLFVDVLMIGLRKIPFACGYYPGRSRGATWWPLYALAFLTYAYGLAAIERLAMSSLPWLSILLASIAAVIAALARLRRVSLRWPPGLIYREEDHGRIFEGFKLSEGLAAESPASGGRSSWLP